MIYYHFDSSGDGNADIEIEELEESKTKGQGKPRALEVGFQGTALAVAAGAATAASSRQQWPCTSCTYINAPHADKCVMCGAIRPLPVTKRVAGAATIAAASSSISASSTYHCSTTAAVSFENDIDREADEPDLVQQQSG